MATIEQKIEALRLARALVEEGESFICCILSRVAKNHPALKEAACHLKKYTEEQVKSFDPINRYTTTSLESWVRVRHSIPDATRNPARAQATRLAWIDWMIACYEEDLAAQVKSHRDYEHMEAQ